MRLNGATRSTALAGDDRIDAAVYDVDETPGVSGDKDRANGNKGDDYIYVNDDDGKDIAKWWFGH